MNILSQIIMYSFMGILTIGGIWTIYQRVKYEYSKCKKR